MKFLVIGTGAIGIYLGGNLALNHHNVVFIARKGSVNAIKKAGLEICKKKEKIHQPFPSVFSNIKEAFGKNNFDAVIITVKAYDVDQVIVQLKPFICEIKALVCFQNGVGTEEKFGCVFGKQKVISGIITSSVSRLSVGSVRLEKDRGMGLSSINKVVFDLIDVFNDAGFKTKYYEKAQDLKWSKLVSNLFANASSAILEMTPKEIFSNPRLFELEMAQIKEAMQVMKSRGWNIVNLPGIPLKLLTRMIESLPVELNQAILGKILASGRGEKMPSFYIDLVRGSLKNEVEYLNGAVVQEGEKLNIPTPVNRLYNQVLTEMIHGNRNIGEFRHNPDKLIDLIS